MSRTIIAAIISVIAGLGMMLGVSFEQGVLDQLQASLNEIVGGVMIVYGIIMAILRKITSSPLLGWFKKA